MIAIRSSAVNSGVLRGLARTATTTESNTVSARATMSRCPLVIGSNEPG